jgi:hypothetical protein
MHNAFLYYLFSKSYTSYFVKLDLFLTNFIVMVLKTTLNSFSN